MYNPIFLVRNEEGEYIFDVNTLDKHNIMLIRPFKDVWNIYEPAGRDALDKVFTFIYFMADTNSYLQKLHKDKDKMVALAKKSSGIKEAWIPDDEIWAAIDYYKEIQPELSPDGKLIASLIDFFTEAQLGVNLITSRAKALVEKASSIDPSKLEMEDFDHLTKADEALMRLIGQGVKMTKDIPDVVSKLKELQLKSLQTTGIVKVGGGQIGRREDPTYIRRLEVNIL